MTKRHFLAAVALGLAACSPPEPVNETHNEELTADDDILEQDQSHYDQYQVKVGEGYGIDIAMTSSAVDSYIILLDGNNQKVGEDDDGGEGNDAHLVMTAPSSGTYTIYANSYSSGETGPYTLTVRTTKPAGS